MKFKKVLDAMPADILKMGMQAQDDRGNFGHKGRPGHRGGSAPRNGSSSEAPSGSSRGGQSTSGDFINWPKGNESNGQYMRKSAAASLRRSMLSGKKDGIQYDLSRLPQGSKVVERTRSGQRTFTKQGNYFNLMNSPDDEGHVLEASRVAQILGQTGKRVANGGVSIDVTNYGQPNGKRSAWAEMERRQRQAGTSWADAMKQNTASQRAESRQATSQLRAGGSSNNVSSFINADYLKNERLTPQQYMKERSLVNLKMAMTSDSPKAKQSLKYELGNMPDGSRITQHSAKGVRTFTRSGDDFIIKTGSGDDGHIVKADTVADLLKAQGDAVKRGERVIIDIDHNGANRGGRR